jgi:hypothetical protein
MRKILDHFDSGGESQRSVRARMLEFSFQILSRESGLRVEPLEISELRCFEGVIFTQCEYQYSLFLPTCQKSLFWNEFISVLLERQHSLMDREHQGVMFKLSKLLHDCFDVAQTTEALQQAGMGTFDDETLCVEAMNRLSPIEERYKAD